MSAADVSSRNCVGCGLRLSRYNTDDRCQSCLRTEMPPQRPEGRPQIDDSETVTEIAYAQINLDGCDAQMNSSEFVHGVPIKVERKARRWTIREMARRLRDAADDPKGVPRDLDSFIHNIYRWEKGDGYGVSERYRFLYCKVFGRTESELFGIEESEGEVPGTARANASACRDSLRRARKAAGFTQESLAKKIGVELTTLYRWEKGISEPSPQFRPKLAEALGISLPELDELLRVDNEPLAPQVDRVTGDEQYYGSELDQRAKTPNLILRRIREVERNETRSEFADAMARVARELGESVGPSERYVARLEDGDVKYPHPPYRRVLAELCKRPIADLGFTRPQMAPDSAMIELAGAMIEPAREDEEEMERRRLLESLAVLGVVISPVGRALDTVRTSFGGVFGYNDSKQLGDWEDVIAEYGHAYLATSPHSLVPDLAADLVTVRSICSRIADDKPEYRGWCRIGGVLSGLMAKTLSNLGNARDSRQWWNIAQHVTDASGDLNLKLWVRGQRLIHGLYENRPSQVLLRQVVAAEELAHGHICSGLADVSTGRAQALILSGDYGAAEEELHRAEEILSQLPSAVTEDTGSVMGWGEDRFRYAETWVYSHIGDQARTDRAAERALRLYPEADNRSPAQIKLMQAFARIQCGDISEGIRHAQAAYEPLASEQYTTTMVDTLARQVLSRVPGEARNRPDVTDYRALVRPSSQRAIES